MKTVRPWGCFLALLLVPAAADAQAAVGLRAGARNAGLAAGRSTGTLTAPVVGGYLGIGLSDRLALQVEGVYGVRGADGLGLGNDALDATAPPVLLEMRHLDVPVLLRAGFPTRRFLVSFFAGPYAAFLIACEVTPEGGPTTSCDDDGAAQRFEPRATDFGFVAGAGLDLALGRTTVFVDARYTVGLQSIQAGDDPFDARHDGVAITGGLAMPLGR